VGESVPEVLKKWHGHELRFRNGLWPRDPAHSAEATARARTTSQATRAADLAWDQDQLEEADEAAFFSETLPAIEAVPVRELAKASGLSFAHRRHIRRELRMNAIGRRCVPLRERTDPKEHLEQIPLRTVMDAPEPALSRV
jgi:hypothetical protein